MKTIRKQTEGKHKKNVDLTSYKTKKAEEHKREHTTKRLLSF